MDAPRPVDAAETPRPLDHLSPSQAEAIREFRMEMPVELWFGEHHIGVKVGTATCVRFQGYANAILAEFHAAVAAAD